MIFLDQLLPAYIGYVSYSEFIQVLKRLLKPSHDCQNAEWPLATPRQVATGSEHIPAP